MKHACYARPSKYAIVSTDHAVVLLLSVTASAPSHKQNLEFGDVGYAFVLAQWLVAVDVCKPKLLRIHVNDTGTFRADPVEVTWFDNKTASAV